MKHLCESIFDTDFEPTKENTSVWSDLKKIFKDRDVCARTAWEESDGFRRLYKNVPWKCWTWAVNVALLFEDIVKKIPANSHEFKPDDFTDFDSTLLVFRLGSHPKSPCLNFVIKDRDYTLLFQQPHPDFLGCCIYKTPEVDPAKLFTGNDFEYVSVYPLGLSMGKVFKEIGIKI